MIHRRGRLSMRARLRHRRRLVEIGLKAKGEVNDFNRRQTDTGVLMLLNTSKLMAEYAARRLRL